MLAAGRRGTGWVGEVRRRRRVLVDLGLAEEASEVGPGRADADLGHLGLAEVLRGSRQPSRRRSGRVDGVQDNPSRRHPERGPGRYLRVQIIHDRTRIPEAIKGLLGSEGVVADEQRLDGERPTYMSAP